MVAHSSGNHALSVAYAAEALGVPAVVVVPDNAPAVKVTAAARHGARIVTVEPTLEARIAGAQELIDRYGYTLIPPFDHRDVIAGQGTIGLEIAADRPDTDLVLVPVSGGGLISGIAAAVRAACPEAKVIGVEPELAADARSRCGAANESRGRPATPSGPSRTRCGWSRSAPSRCGTSSASSMTSSR